MTTYTSVFGGDTIPLSSSGYAAINLSSNTTLLWPETSTGPNLAADIIDLTATGAYNLTLPDASMVSVGRSLLINNTSAYSISLRNAAGSELSVLASGDVKNVYITDNTSAAGVWRVYTFGTGTSTAEASSLAGYGLSVISGDLAQTSPVKITTSSAAVMVSDRAGTYVFQSTGMVTCDLPAASSAGDGFFLNIVNQGTGAVSIDPSASELVDGAFTKDLAPGESATAICDGTNWVTVGYGRSTQFQFTKLVLDITTGSPFTLTSTQAQNKLLQFIGSPTAPVTVNLPAVVAVYYVECAFSGAFLLRLQTASGAGVYASGTDRIIIYCDGVDVVFAQTTGLPATSLAGGTAGAVVYQSAVDITGYSLTGVTGQLLTSGGTGRPIWVDRTAASIANVPAGGVSAENVQAAINELDVEKVPRTSLTGSAKLPAGTTAQRDGTPIDGMIRYNSTLLQFEGYFNGLWQSVGGGQMLGLAETKAIFFNAQTITEDLTIKAGTNGGSFGPMGINDGVTVTIEDGAVWSIV